jgi:hypothetical protein
VPSSMGAEFGTAWRGRSELPRFGSGHHQRLARDDPPPARGDQTPILTSCYRRTVIDDRSESSLETADQQSS